MVIKMDVYWNEKTKQLEMMEYYQCAECSIIIGALNSDVKELLQTECPNCKSKKWEKYINEDEDNNDEFEDDYYQEDD